MAQNNKVKRDAIAQKVYARITDSSPVPGRFVEKNEDGSYTVKSKEFAIGKIKRGLSENSATVKAYLMRRGIFTVQPSNDKRFSNRSYKPKGKKERLSPLLFSSHDQMTKNNRNKTITKDDFWKLYHEISNIDESKIKQVRRY